MGPYKKSEAWRGRGVGRGGGGGTPSGLLYLQVLQTGLQFSLPNGRPIQSFQPEEVGESTAA